MIETYQNEIIALIALIVVTIFYFIAKNRRNTKTVPKDNEVVEEVIEVQTNVEPLKEEKLEVPQKSEPEFKVEGKEEGSFGVQSTPEATQKVKSKPLKSKIKKRDVPPHGKIVKQDFKDFSGLKILVAEDNLINQKVITGLLADTGIEISIANDGIEALEILEKDSSFKIVIMDAHMPRMDGFEATRAIRNNPNYKHIVVVALSGDVAADDIRKMTEAGMQEHLEKPLRMNPLYDVFYAYSSPQIDEEFITVVSTHELNGDKGLDICGGDEDFYKEILNEFVQTYENSIDRLPTLLQEDKLKEADRFLLDVIGITANIGADNLNQIATAIKDRLDDTQEKSYLTLGDQYKKHLQELLKDIKEYL